MDARLAVRLSDHQSSIHVHFIHVHFLCQLAILPCLLCLPCLPCLPRLHPQVWPAMPFLKSPLPSSSRSNNIQLVAWTYTTDWWFGTWILFFHSVGNVIIPTDELIFFRGIGSITTNQIISPLPKMARPLFFAIGYRFFIVRPAGLPGFAGPRCKCAAPDAVLTKSCGVEEGETRRTPRSAWLKIGKLSKKI